MPKYKGGKKKQLEKKILSFKKLKKEEMNYIRAVCFLCELDLFEFGY